MKALAPLHRPERPRTAPAPRWAGRGAAAAGLGLALMAAPAWAQQAPAEPQTLDAVKLHGQRNGGVDPSVVTAAKSKVLSRRFASSCGFLAGYSAADDDATLAYLRDFRMQDSPSNDSDRFSDLSPAGDAKSASVASALNGLADTGSTADPMAASTACGPGDRRLAAGRHWIARKDKSLSQGFEAFEAERYDEARQRFEEAWRKLGYEEAALMLGRLHLLGLGTPASTPSAITWLREVLDARYDPASDRLRFDPRQPDQVNTRVEAALLLARIHLTGQGTPRDPAQAYRAWQQALDFGFEPAGTWLAEADLAGIGTARDPRRALAHLQAAAEAGVVPALFRLGQLYHHQGPQSLDAVPLDLQRAGAYYGAAARAGHVEATYAAARMFDNGEGVAAAPERALVLYKEAAVKGHAGAQNALATFFYRGEGVPQNLETARQLFQSAARARQPDAMFNLAVMLAQGQGGPRDLVAAYAWCSLSAELGHAQAATAQPALAARLSADERRRAEALLRPTPKAPGS